LGAGSGGTVTGGGTGIQGNMGIMGGISMTSSPFRFRVLGFCLFGFNVSVGFLSVGFRANTLNAGETKLNSGSSKSAGL